MPNLLKERELQYTQIHLESFVQRNCSSELKWISKSKTHIFMPKIPIPTTTISSLPLIFNMPQTLFHVAKKISKLQQITTMFLHSYIYHKRHNLINNSILFFHQIINIYIQKNNFFWQNVNKENHILSLDKLQKPKFIPTYFHLKIPSKLVQNKGQSQKPIKQYPLSLFHHQNQTLSVSKQKQKKFSKPNHNLFFHSFILSLTNPNQGKKKKKKNPNLI